MRISTKGRYGLRAMIALARHEGDGPLLMGRIAEDQDVSRKYLHALLTALRSAGLVRSIRGARGGYVLARPAEEITALQIVEALEGPMALTECVVDGGTCARESGCAAHDLWADMSERLQAGLRGIPLATLVQRQVAKEAADAASGG